MRRLAIFIAVLTTLAAPARAADTPVAPRSAVALPPEKAAPVRVARLDTPPSIDGRLDEEEWKPAALFKDFYQTYPGDNAAPSHPTEVRIGYDAKNLYVAFHAFDEPGKVRATVARRDQIHDDDTVGIVLDTYADRRRAYRLEFNPFGIQSDGLMSGGGYDQSVDVLMESKGAITTDGFAVEVAIPFASLRYRAGEGVEWGIHLTRSIGRDNGESDSWMPISRDRTDYLAQAGRITGLEGLASAHALEVIPTITAVQGGGRVAAPPGLGAPDRFVTPAPAFDQGITVKYGITPTVTFDLAINPDFAQVEADGVVVTANQRFPIFYAEKRPFFLEGVEIFQNGLTTVHTRAIVDPDAAAKLTGKVGKTTFGLLLASDAAPGNYSEEEREDPDLLPSIAKFLDKNATVGVLRVKRDVGSESNVGLLATSYDFVEQHNHVFAVDGRLKLDPQSSLTFDLAGSTSRQFFYDPDAEASEYRTGNGLAYHASYGRSLRHLGYSFSASGRTEDYRQDVGFQTRTGFSSDNASVYYSSEPKTDGLILSWNAYASLGALYDHAGRLHSWSQYSSLNVTLPRQTYVGVGFDGGYERLFEEEFGARRTDVRQGAFFGEPERGSYEKGLSLNFSAEPSQKISFGAYWARGTGRFDYDFGAGPRFPRVSPAALTDPFAPLDPGPSTGVDAGAFVSSQPTQNVAVSVSYSRSSLRRRDTRLLVYVDDIYTLHTTYQFTRALAARAIVDYDTLGSSARGQFLVSWTPSPGTAVYLGYDDALSVNGFNPFTGAPEPGFRRDSRTVFVKISYLFRFDL